MGLKNVSRTGAKVEEFLQRWQIPEKNTNGLGLKIHQLMQGISRWTTEDGSFSDGFLKTPPIYNTTTAFCYITMSSPQVFSLFQIRNGASDLSSTGYFSVQSHKLWQRMIIPFYTQHYHRRGVACLDFFFIYHHFCVSAQCSEDSQEFANYWTHCQGTEFMEIFKSQLDTALARLLSLTLLWRTGGFPSTSNIL